MLFIYNSTVTCSLSCTCDLRFVPARTAWFIHTSDSVLKTRPIQVKKGNVYIQTKLLCTLSIMSHKKRRAKYQTIAYCENNSSGQEVKLQVKFPVKKTP